MNDRECTSKYASAARGLVRCAEVGGHITHRGEGYNWKDKDEYREPKPAVTPVDKGPKTEIRGEEPSASERQVGGDHYGDDLQPIDVIDSWGLDFYEGSALKYLARHRKKNGAEDIKKAIHYLELLLERQYSE